MPYPKKYYRYNPYGKSVTKSYVSQKFSKSRKDKYSAPFRYRRYIESWRFGYVDLIDQTQQKSIICPSGYTWGQGWGVLNKCWVGFKIAKNLEQSLENMKSFAKKIQSIQYDLGIKKTDFSHIGLPGEVLVLYDKPRHANNRPRYAQLGVEIEFDRSEEKDKEKEENAEVDDIKIPEEEINTEEVLKDIWLKDTIDSKIKTEQTE